MNASPVAPASITSDQRSIARSSRAAAGRRHRSPSFDRTANLGIGSANVRRSPADQGLQGRCQSGWCQPGLFVASVSTCGMVMCWRPSAGYLWARRRPDQLAEVSDRGAQCIGSSVNGTVTRWPGSRVCKCLGRVNFVAGQLPGLRVCHPRVQGVPTVGCLMEFFHRRPRLFGPGCGQVHGPEGVLEFEMRRSLQLLERR
jgi:hypothetical protein